MSQSQLSVTSVDQKLCCFALEVIVCPLAGDRKAAITDRFDI